MDLKSPLLRILAGSFLLILLLSSSLYYALEDKDYLDYPSYDVILSQYPQGATVNVYGTVTKHYSGGYEIQQNFKGQVITMRIQSSTNIPTINEYVSLLGILGPDHQIIKVISVYRTEKTEPWRNYFLIFRSLLALIFLSYFFLRYWYFDSRKFEFRRR